MANRIERAEKKKRLCQQGIRDSYPIKGLELMHLKCPPATAVCQKVRAYVFFNTSEEK
jgi:hypothetical protein